MGLVGDPRGGHLVSKLCLTTDTGPPQVLWLEAIFREILVAIWVPGRNREIRAKFGCLWQNLGKIRASQSHFGVSLLPKSDLVGQSDKLAWCISNITRNLGQNMGPDGEIWASKFG